MIVERATSVALFVVPAQAGMHFAEQQVLLSRLRLFDQVVQVSSPGPQFYTRLPTGWSISKTHEYIPVAPSRGPSREAFEILHPAGKLISETSDANEFFQWSGLIIDVALSLDTFPILMALK
ncbi:hypothetical protein F6455_17465 [Proteobacteria bacterium 005FR1]|nr:hypothetical protein [Proteobacteria bacterium 005FR1]